jgi:7-cyano-7-deazaguanine synthase
MRPKVVIILSGGMDSATLLYDLRRTYEVFALSFNYGQRHQVELAYARDLCRRTGTPIEVVPMQWFSSLCGEGSSQTDPAVEVPEGHYTDQSMRKTVVPNRNMVMLSVATAYALNVGAEMVAFGAHAGDHAIYPDCRRSFVDALGDAIELCDYAPCKLVAPYLDFTKTDIAELGAEWGVPYELTWTCYKGGGLHCGKCGACVERREALATLPNGDPTIYQEA